MNKVVELNMSMPTEKKEHAHYQGDDPLQHVVKKQTEGIVSLAESHGAETPGHISSCADAMREVAFLMLLLGGVSHLLYFSANQILLLLGIFACGLITWKVGRSAWHGWSRLERLHRLIEQERWEILHHREQEREELEVLYRAKGFEGKLLNSVTDVLMADNNRLLRVMLEEEMGLKLESHEHPLKQGFWAGLGAFVSAVIALTGCWLGAYYGLLVASLLAVAIGASLTATFEKNRMTSAIIWNLGITVVAYSTVHFTLSYIMS